MKYLSCLSYLFYMLFFFVFSYPSFSLEEVAFNLKRKKQKETIQIKKQNPIPLKFKRHSFSYSEDFVIFNEKPRSDLKAGAVLTVHTLQTIIAGFNEEFQVYGVVISPFKAVLSGKVRAIKSANKALIVFDEITHNGETKTLETFPVFLNGSLKESLFKDMVLNFTDSFPLVLALALKSQIPQTGIHFINTDFKDKISEFSNKKKEKQKSQKLEYLEIKNTKLLKVIVR